jgi:histidyl-tRNA synthetase
VPFQNQSVALAGKGGNAGPSTSFAAQAGQTEPPALADAYIAPIGEEQDAAALALARELRRAGLRVELGDGSFRLKKSFEIGNKVARAIVLLGEDEHRSGILTVKDFATGEQKKVARGELAQALR